MRLEAFKGVEFSEVFDEICVVPDKVCEIQRESAVSNLQRELHRLLVKFGVPIDNDGQVVNMNEATNYRDFRYTCPTLLGAIPGGSTSIGVSLRSSIFRHPLFFISGETIVSPNVYLMISRQSSYKTKTDFNFELNRFSKQEKYSLSRSDFAGGLYIGSGLGRDDVVKLAGVIGELGDNLYPKYNQGGYHKAVKDFSRDLAGLNPTT